MKKFVLLGIILSIHIVVRGDMETQCQTLIDKANKEYDLQNYAKALEYLIEAEIIADKNNLVMLQMRALNAMGIIYNKTMNYEKAIEQYMKVYQKTVKDPDKYKVAEVTILINISGIYVINKDYEKGKEYVHKAYNGAMLLQDSMRAGAAAANIASYANKMGNLEEAEEYVNIAMNMLRPQDSLYLLTAKGIKVENLFLKKEYDKAEHLALKLLNKNLTVQNSEIKAEILLILSRIYQEKKEFQKAITVAKEALDNSSQLQLIVEIHEQLSKLYLDVDDPYLANQYLNSMIMTKDSLNTIMNMNNIMINQAKFDLANSEKALAENKAKQKEERMFFMFMLVFIIIFAILLIFIQSTRNKQRKRIIELELQQEKKQKSILEQQVKEKEMVALLEQERFNTEMESKNKWIIAQLLSQSNKNEFIKEMINKLSDILHQWENPMLESMIRGLKIELNASLEWENFLTHFEQIHPSLLTSLKNTYPNLTINDIQLLTCIYLNLDTQKIAYLLNTSIDTCRKKKQRLAAKMNLKVPDIYDYFRKTPALDWKYINH